MAIKHGISHALATFVTSVASAVISSIIIEKLHTVNIQWQKVGIFFSRLFYIITRVKISGMFFNIILMASIFAFLWGMIFEIIHRIRRRRYY